MQDFSKLNAMISQARHQAVIGELEQLLFEGTEISDQIVLNLLSKGFTEITQLQVSDILHSIKPKLRHEIDSSDDSLLNKTHEEVTEPDALLPVSVYPRALPGWDQRATHALVNGHHRAFGLYDIETNYMTLLAGSAIADEWTGDEGGYGEALENIITLSNTTKRKDGKLILLVDVICLSPACAASLVFGRSISSTGWQDGHGRYMQKPKKSNRRRFGNGFSAQPLFSNESNTSPNQKTKESKNSHSSFELKSSVSDFSLSGMHAKPPVKMIDLPSGTASRRSKKRR